MMNPDLDEFLNMRKTPDTPGGLEARIIDTARHMPQNPAKQRVIAWWKEFLELFALPAPAYALAGVFVFGLAMGIFSEAPSLLPDLTPRELASFMSVEDEFTATDFINGEFT